MNEYTKQVLDDFTSRLKYGFNWPEYFNRDRILSMLKNILPYYESKEEYEKCGVLKDEINRIESRNGTLSVKEVKKRGRPKKNKI